MLNAIQAGILTSSTKERLEQLEETKRELEARIAEEKLAKPKVTEEFIWFWLLRFRKLDMSLKDQRQALVDTFINAIYLYFGNADAVPHTEPQRGASERNRRLRRLLARRSAGAVLKPQGGNCAVLP